MRGIERAEGVVVDAEPRRRPPREAVDHDVGFLDESIELLTAIDTVQIQADTSLAPIPDPVPGLLRKWISQRRLYPYDIGAVVDKEHGGHGAGHAPGQIENT